MRNLELSNQERLRRNRSIRDLMLRLGEKSELERNHAARVAVYATATGQTLGLGGTELLSLRYAAELHDIGKLSFPPDLFSLESAEGEDLEQIRAHPSEGVKLLAGIDWLVPSLPAILQHHEAWDGSGYPNGIGGDQICLEARIIAVSEAFDAMTMPCGWRSQIPEAEALAELKNCLDSQFDPQVFAAFQKVQTIIQPVGL